MVKPSKIRFPPGVVPIDAGCKFCRWCSFPIPYTQPDKTEAFLKTYKCQRRAPIATGGMMSAPQTIWPEVDETNYCGEWEEKVELD